jgi:hypothetical protein
VKTKDKLASCEFDYQEHLFVKECSLHVFVFPKSMLIYGTVYRSMLFASLTLPPMATEVSSAIEK